MTFKFSRLLFLLLSCVDLGTIESEHLWEGKVRHPDVQFFIIYDEYERNKTTLGQYAELDLSEAFQSYGLDTDERAVLISCKRNKTESIEKCYNGEIGTQNGCNSDAFCFYALISDCTFDVPEEIEAFERWQNSSGSILVLCLTYIGIDTDDRPPFPVDVLSNWSDEIKNKWRRANETEVHCYSVDTKVPWIRRVMPSFDVRDWMARVIPLVDFCNCAINASNNNICELVSGRQNVFYFGYPWIDFKRCISNGEIAKCSESDCACERIPWQPGDCSVTCGEGIQTPWRKVSVNPMCNTTGTPEACISSDMPVCSTELGKITEKSEASVIQISSIKSNVITEEPSASEKEPRTKSKTSSSEKEISSVTEIFGTKISLQPKKKGKSDMWIFAVTISVVLCVPTFIILIVLLLLLCCRASKSQEGIVIGSRKTGADIEEGSEESIHTPSPPSRSRSSSIRSEKEKSVEASISTHEKSEPKEKFRTS